MTEQLPQQLSHLLGNLNNYILSNPKNQQKSTRLLLGASKKINQEEVAPSIYTLSDFWTSSRLCVTLDELEDMLIGIGYILRETDKRKLVADGVELITLENVLNGVEQWKWQQRDVTTYLANKSLQTKIVDAPKIQKPTMFEEELESYNEEFVSKYESPSNKKYQLSSSYIHSTSTHNKMLNLTRSYLNEHTLKQQRNKLKLMNTLRRVDNEYDYQITVKVGQTNDFCKKLKNGMSYVLNKKPKKVDQSKTLLSINRSTVNRTQAVDTLTIVECSKDGTSKELKMFEFQRKYQGYKQAAMNLAEEFEGSIEEDLKKVLVEVMCLRSQMQQQVALLERKGVSS